MRVISDPTGPALESVWFYSRPAVAELSQRRLRIVHRDVVIADTRRGVRTSETSHPPSNYFPMDEIAAFVLRPSRLRSVCAHGGDRPVRFLVHHERTVSVTSTTVGLKKKPRSYWGADENNPQIITMGSRVIGSELAKSIAEAFPKETFDPHGRSAGNVAAIDTVDAKYKAR